MTSAYSETPQASQDRILAQLQGFFPEAADGRLQALLGAPKG